MAAETVARGQMAGSAKPVGSPWIYGIGAASTGPSYRAAPEHQAAGVVELVDTPDLGSGGFGRGGSSPFARTTVARPSTVKPIDVRIEGDDGQ